MLKDFRTYQIAKEFHQIISLREKEIPGYIRNQLLRASSSVVLNLAEGSGKNSKRDKLRFYWIAMGSLRESQASLELAGAKLHQDLLQQSDHLAANLYCLIKALSKKRWS